MPVKINGRWGYIDKTGRVVIPLQFDIAPDEFSNGLARVEVDHRYGYFNKTGQVVIRLQFTEVENFCKGLALIHKGDLDGYGYINKSGRTVIPFQFDIQPRFRRRLCPKFSRDEWLSLEGELVVMGLHHLWRRSYSVLLRSVAQPSS